MTLTVLSMHVIRWQFSSVKDRDWINWRRAKSIGDHDFWQVITGGLVLELISSLKERDCFTILKFFFTSSKECEWLMTAEFGLLCFTGSCEHDRFWDLRQLPALACPSTDSEWKSLHLLWTNVPFEILSMSILSNLKFRRKKLWLINIQIIKASYFTLNGFWKIFFCDFLIFTF